jgi:excisionase family DNA binding protein
MAPKRTTLVYGTELAIDNLLIKGQMLSIVLRHALIVLQNATEYSIGYTTMASPKRPARVDRPLALGTEVLTTAQAAQDCNVSVRTLYRAIKSGQLKAYRLNKDFRLKSRTLKVQNCGSTTS